MKLVELERWIIGKKNLVAKKRFAPEISEALLDGWSSISAVLFYFCEEHEVNQISCRQSNIWVQQAKIPSNWCHSWNSVDWDIIWQWEDLGVEIEQECLRYFCFLKFCWVIVLCLATTPMLRNLWFPQDCLEDLCIMTDEKNPHDCHESGVPWKKKKRISLRMW